MIQAKQGKQKGILKNPIGENTPHGKKDDKSLCIRCGGSHSLWECPKITDEQLGELLNQLGGEKKGQIYSKMRALRKEP
jgi:hypothetical protein